MTWDQYVWTIVAAAAGAFLGSYLKKVGENLAKKEDLDNVVAEMKKVTKAAEDIKSEISHRKWNRERQWELKRDLMLDATEGIGNLANAITDMNGSLRWKAADPNWKEENERHKQSWNKAASAFEIVRARVPIVCGQATQDSLEAFFETASKCAGFLIFDRKTEAEKMFHDVRVKHFAALHALRRELGIEDVSPRSSESSEALAGC